ncbi:cobalamin biosynthesis protein CobW (plasmid) [Sulfitobacter alexandrii]|uniref:Cobalamin biosynthesis protein CobW n=1 Tax=Sulfitobacter alexandrii TaxID=1917485 RepID=A0A1J0WNV7_9RHOB|nr:CobW family GTP-binding protein [Sulfitobacter alexandrii]APE45973.1 cobalamin biosynthesis protein CobW [Sulfitobacter alexandrii]
MSVPVLLVTGFLGAGKTTLINALLQADHGLRIAAIVNDFGAINIDAALVGPSADGVIGLRNGCICCSLQGDLLRTLKIVLGQSPSPELIVIEASGVADPAGITRSLTDPVIWNAARLQTVACVIDATDAARRRDDPLWQAQARGSDMLLLAKSGLVDMAARDRLSLSLAAAFRQRLLDLESGLPLPALLDPDGPTLRASSPTPLRDDRFVHLDWTCDGPVPLDAFQRVMGRLAPDLLRAKGFLRLKGRETRVLFQLSGQRATLSAAEEDGAEGCQLVLIGQKDSFDPDAARIELDALARA